MKSYKLTQTADRQLQEIWRYTCDRWGRERADAYLGEIHDAILAALATPALLRPRPDLYDGVLARRAGAHIVYGVRSGDVYAVIAVLHARMDPKRRLVED